MPHLPADIFSGLPSLERIRLNESQLTSLPAGIFSGLASLEILNLDENQLSSLPEGLLSGLVSLEEIHLNENQLTSLPAGILSGLTSLEGLYLYNNQLPSLPEGLLSGLPSLEEIHLHSNQLTSLPEGIFSGLPSLKFLHLEGNQLPSSPGGIFSGSASLEKIYLSGNQLPSLPEGIFSGLVSLEEIHLQKNQLTSLPEGIFSGLTSLEFLYLHNNLADRLPINVSLEWVDPGRLQARVHTGAPFEIRLPITVSNGVFHENSSHLTIPAGQETSDVLSVSRQPGTTSPVTVEIAQLPDEPGHHRGYALVRPSMPLIVLGPLSLDFPHFANGASITSDLVFVNVASTPIQPALYFFDREGNLMAPASVVDVGEDQLVGSDGALTVRKAIEPLGELTVSTHGRGPVVTGSVRVLADGPMGGVLRFDSPDIGVAGVGTGFPSLDAIFPARRRESGINTGAAIRNLGEDPTTVNCQLTQKGQVLDDVDIPLSGNGQTAQFIDELFPWDIYGKLRGIGAVQGTRGFPVRRRGFGNGFPEPDLHDLAGGSRSTDADAGLHAAALPPFRQRGVHRFRLGARERGRGLDPPRHPISTMAPGVSLLPRQW